MNKICWNCKFCVKQLIPVKFSNVDDFIEKYFCKYYPNEMETTPENWCGQFKSKDEED